MFTNTPHSSTYLNTSIIKWLDVMHRIKTNENTEWKVMSKNIKSKINKNKHTWLMRVQPGFIRNFYKIAH